MQVTPRAKIGWPIRRTGWRGAHFAYLHLEHWSRGARYDAAAFDEREVNSALNQYLLKVEYWISP